MTTVVEPAQDAVFSRERLAGYDQAAMFAGKVLVVGVGALGQNVVLNLALTGIGNIVIVDHDVFEPHNATRSPLYPMPADQDRFGRGKAPVCAAKAASIATAPQAAVRYAAARVQPLGDGLIRWADVVVSAVDDVSTRAWLAERCRLQGRPMVEGGFEGSRLNVSVFGVEAEAPCYRCLNPGRASMASCTRYARQAEAESIIPAIQTAAAVCAGIMAEQVVAWLHGVSPLAGRRAYGDVRAGHIDVATLSVDPRCPGFHGEPDGAVHLDVDESCTFADLIAAVHELAPGATIELAEPFVMRGACTACGSIVHARVQESIWLKASRCSACGGMWDRTSSPSPCTVSYISADSFEDGLDSVVLRDAGIRSGSGVVIHCSDGAMLVGLVPGDALSVTEMAGTVPR